MFEKIVVDGIYFPDLQILRYDICGKEKVCVTPFDMIVNIPKSFKRLEFAYASKQSILRDKFIIMILKVDKVHNIFFKVSTLMLNYKFLVTTYGAKTISDINEFEDKIVKE